MKTTLAAPLLLLALLAGCAGTHHAPKDGATVHAHAPITTDVLEPYSCGSVQRLHTFRGLFLASQPELADFEQAREGGVRTVVDLRAASEERGFDEAAAVNALGLAYENLPFRSVAQLDDAVFDRARELFRTVERPALVHCSSGNRVGAVWIPYRVLDDGLGLEEAVAEARTIGLRSADYEAAARAYVGRHRAAH